MTHAEFLDWLSGLLSERAREAGRALLVGIDGPDAVGKTTLADELAVALRAAAGLRGTGALRISADDFLNPPEIRYRRGRFSAEGYCLDSVNYAALADRLRDARQSQPHSAREDGGEVVLVDGIFLRAPELDGLWDFVIYLDAPPEISLARARARARSEAGECSRPSDDSPNLEHLYQTRYLPGQAYYRLTRQPDQRADLCVAYADLAHPTIKRRTGPIP